MSSSGQALAQAIGQFGQSFQQMGETIYKVQAENEFRNESLKIADEIEQFNNSLLTDPDHGTPGVNDGYMKKWNDLKKTFDQRIASVKNPLAKKNLEGYMAEAQTSQNSRVYGLQFNGWSKQMVADAETRINGIISNMAVSTDFKLAQINEELESLLSQNLIDEKQYGEYRSNFAKAVVSQDFIKRVVLMAKEEGYTATKNFILGEVSTVRMIGGVPVSIDTADFSRAQAVLDYTVEGDQKAGDDEAIKFSDLVLSGKATDADYQKIIDSPNMSYSQKMTSAREWYQSKGDREMAAALIGVSDYYAFARGETVTPDVKYTTLGEVQGLLKAGKIKNQEYLTIIGIFNQAKDLIEKSDRSKELKSLLADIIDGKVQTVDEVNSRSPEGDTSALSFFLQTQDKNKADSQVKTANDGLGKIRSLEKKITEGASGEEDFKEIETWLEDNKETLGSSYGTISNGISQLRWKHVDSVSAEKSRMIEKKIRENPALVSDSDIWSKDLSAADSSRLATLKYSMTKDADITDSDRAAKEVIKRYQTNILIKSGAIPEPGQQQLTEEYLDSVKDKLPLSVYESFSSQLSRDLVENAWTEKYLGILKDIREGKKIDIDLISKDASIPFNAKIDLIQKAMEGAEDSNAYLVNEKYQAAKRTATGTLRDGESPVSVEDLREYISTFDSKALPLSVRKLYQDAADLLDTTMVADKLDREIRSKGEAWVANGIVNEDEATALLSSIDNSVLIDKAGMRALLDTFRSNAKAVARQMAYDQQNAEDRQYTASQRAEAAAKKDAQAARKIAAQQVRDEFIKDLGKGMTPEQYLGYQLQYEEIYREAPEEYSSSFHPLEVLYVSKQDAEYGKKEYEAQKAFSELVNSSMIEGWEKTTDHLSYDMINKIFPSDSEADNKGRAYWTEKLRTFLMSDEASQTERTNAVNALIAARSNRWAGLYGSPEYNKDAPMLTSELLKQYRGVLKISDMEGFGNDIDSFARAEYAFNEAAKKEAAGTTHSPAEVAAGKDVYSRLQGYAAMLAMGTISSGYASQTITITKNGVDHQVTLTPEVFEAVLQENAAQLIASGDWGAAVALKQKFMGKVTNPVWKPVEDAIKEITSNGKYYNKFPPELQNWVDLEIAQTTNPTPEYISTLISNLKTRVHKLDMRNYIKLKQGAWDVSEDYLSAVGKGELEPFIGTVNGRVVATLQEFNTVITGWAENTLKQVNYASGANILTEGKNAKRELFTNGHLQFRVTDQATLKALGASGTEAVYYMAFYGNDALPAREVKNKDGGYVQTFIPWEKDGEKNGRWVHVEAKRDVDGITRFQKTQAQINADIARGIIEKEPPDSIKAVENYPGMGI